MSKRATIGKVLIAAAVLVPMLLLGAALAYEQIAGVGVRRTPGATHYPWPLLALDAAVLLLGLWLIKGEEI